MPEVVVVTTTFYGSTAEPRFGLTCKTIELARQAGRVVVVVDGSPDPSIADTFRALGALVFPQEKPGMGASRRQAFGCAIQHLRDIGEPKGVVFWTEPEKHDIIRFIPEIVEPLESGALVVIPNRSQASWKTYPEFQVVSEQAANAAYARHTGREGYDPMFGPVAFLVTPEIENLLLNFDPEKHGVPDTYVQHYIPLFLTGETVASVEVDFVYPPDQREQEESADNEEIRKKRAWQLETLVKAYEILGKAA